MLIVNRGCVSHNGEVFKRGEMLPAMTKLEQQRLLDLGVCVEGGTPSVIIGQAENTQPANDLNLNFNAEEAIQGKK